MASATISASKTSAKKKAGPKKHVAMAIHAKDEDGIHHVVGMKNIRVVIVPDDGSYFAQGLDIDYAAQGETIEEVKSNFEKGFKATIDQHLKVYGSLRNFIRVAPAEICQHLLLDSSAQFKSFAQISAHEVHEALGYKFISYLVAEAAAAC